MKPVLQALLLADHVYVDRDSGKPIIAGVFHTLIFVKNALKPDQDSGEHKLPISPTGFQAGSPFCYINLTEVHGEQHFELRFVDLSSDRALLRVPFAVKTPSPLSQANLILPLLKLPADKPGVFALELTWKDEPLGSYRVNVEDGSKKEGDDDN